MPEHASGVEPLVRQGIVASAAGDHARARELLVQALRQDPGNVQAWLHLSGEVGTVKARAYCLERVLALDPGNEAARRGLAWLREETRPVPARQAAAGATTAEVAPAPPVPAGRAAWLAGSGFVLIAALGLVLLTLIILANRAGVEALQAPLPLLRLLLGLAFVLLVPGYALQAALFPQADALDGPERLALSFGLSIAVVPPLALILNWLPWGIRLWPIVIGEGLVILLCSTLALWRRHRLPPAERFRVEVSVDVRGWWAAQDRTSRVLYGVLAAALVLALASAAAIGLQPNPGEQFTEFYILGPEGLAENYPRQAAPGEPLSVTAGVHNLEGVPAEYRIEVRAGDLGDGAVVGEAGPFTLAAGETWEGAISYALPAAGADQQVHFYLYRNRSSDRSGDWGAEPYRSLRLWIDIVPEAGS